jgi:serine phosphatase RsbU (regulator of sigma subunit)/Tfp pilus assembly protein PilF
MKAFIPILIFLFSLNGFAQLSSEEQAEVDSLKEVISTASHDTIVLSAYMGWDNIIYMSNPKLDFELVQKIEALCLENLKKELNEQEKKSYAEYLSFAYNSLGLIYTNHGNYSKALEFSLKSLNIDEGLDYKQGVASSYNNIGNIYADQENDIKAMEYYQKCYELRKELGDRKELSSSLNNIGNIYANKENYEKAMEFYFKSLEIDTEFNDEEGMVIALHNIGNIYESQGNIVETMKFFEKALILAKKLKMKSTISGILSDMGGVALDKKEYKKAIALNVEALAIAQKIGAIYETQDAAELLYESYKLKGDADKALKMHELYIATKDSIKSEENQKEIIRQEFKLSYEKQKVLDDATHDKQMAISAEQEKKQKVIIYAVVGGLGLVILFSIFIFNRLQVTRKQKVLIETQKNEVEHQKIIIEESHKEITDSIAYAKRIQSAILPPDKLVKEYLKESFILYKPKDVVAGDFYWMEHKENNVLFAAADCTGHGVPGAMVSVVCNNALNRSVREYNLSDPGKILDKTREIVIQEFEKSDEEVKDGMDIALCSLEGNILKYAGAHNPLWIIRNGEIIETKANKEPIGQFDNPTPYTTHDFELQKGDSVYIFSDGYVDQFGGEKGKKFKSNSFKSLLLEIQNSSMSEQKQLIDTAFEEWKGGLEQIDDVCVIGVRV